MFARLLQLATEKKLIVGTCIHPSGPSGYQVEIWIGPSMGERREWCERFSCDIPPMEALDRVAAIAEERHGAAIVLAGNFSAFYRPAPHRDWLEPDVSIAAGGLDKQWTASRIHQRENICNTVNLSQ